MEYTQSPDSIPAPRRPEDFVERGSGVDRRQADLGLPEGVFEDRRKGDRRTATATMLLDRPASLLTETDEAILAGIDERVLDATIAEILSAPDSKEQSSEALGSHSPIERREKEPRFTLREATLADIPAIVDVDIRSFDGVYGTSRLDAEELSELRAEKTAMFERRLELVGGYWMPVLEKDGKIVGFMNSCPTSKGPEDFKSWEDTTNDGTLEPVYGEDGTLLKEGTYDPNGKNVYVVTLSVLPEGTKGKEMLTADQIGKFLEDGYETSFFESRIPGFSNWVSRKIGKDHSVDDLSKETLDEYAEEYFKATITLGGKEVPRDRLLRTYDQMGCKLLRVVPDAYQDPESLNYGVVCIYDGEELFDGSAISILGKNIPDNRMTRKALGRYARWSGQSQARAAKLFAPTGPREPKLTLGERVRKHKTKLALGAAALSATATLMLSPVSETVDNVKEEVSVETAAVVGGGLVALEVGWNAGALMMLGAVGKKVRNPLKIKGQMQGLAQEAVNSRLFKTGLAINTASAVGQFVLPATAIALKLPPESWGVATPFAADLAATVAVRYSLWSGLKSAAASQEEATLEA